MGKTNQVSGPVPKCNSQSSNSQTVKRGKRPDKLSRTKESVKEKKLAAVEINAKSSPIAELEFKESKNSNNSKSSADRTLPGTSKSNGTVIPLNASLSETQNIDIEKTSLTEDFNFSANIVEESLKSSVEQKRTNNENDAISGTTFNVVDNDDTSIETNKTQSIEKSGDPLMPPKKIPNENYEDLFTTSAPKPMTAMKLRATDSVMHIFGTHSSPITFATDTIFQGLLCKPLICSEDMFAENTGGLLASKVSEDPIIKTTAWLESTTNHFQHNDDILEARTTSDSTLSENVVKWINYTESNSVFEQHKNITQIVIPCPSCKCSTTSNYSNLSIKRNAIYNDNVKIIKPSPGSYRKPKLEKLMLDIIVKRRKTDYLIVIGDYQFNCHICVLKAYSARLKDEIDGEGVVVFHIDPDEVSPYAFAQIYEWMVADAPQLNRVGLLEILKAAEYLKMHHLLNHIWQLLRDKEICDDHAFILYLEACALDLQTVRKAMLERISKFFLTFVSSREYAQMNCDDLYHLLSSNHIGVNTEIEVLMAAVRWLNYNWAEREPLAVRVIEAVRFTLMPPWFLAQIAHNTYDSLEMQRVLNDNKIDLMIHEALSVNLVMYNESLARNCPSARSAVIAQRLWIFDVNCPYHTKGQREIEMVTYTNFVKYLDFLSSSREYYFQTLEILAPDLTSK